MAKSDFFCGQPPASDANTDTSWDLASNWSDTSNPARNGVWAYVYSNVGCRLPIKMTNWNTTDFYSGQPAWTYDPAMTTPAMFKSRGLARSLDLPTGRVGGYPNFSVRWTAPRDAIVDLTGGVWLARQYGGKGNMITVIMKRGGVETTLFSATVKPRSQGFTSSRPYALSQAATDNGADASLLRFVGLKRGDSLIVRSNGDPVAFGPDYMGIDLSVATSVLSTGLAGVKEQPDGTSIGIAGGLVTAVFSGCFYVESEDRTNGIRVEVADHGLSVGDSVDIAGTVRTNDSGERYIDADGVVSHSN
jgi:hypothetical protein